MPERRTIDSQGYLDKKSEGQEWKPIVDQEQIGRLGTPLAEVDLSVDGKVEIKTDQVEVTFDQSTVDRDSIKEIVGHAPNYVRPGTDLSADWKRISNFSMKTTDGEHEFCLPADCQVYYLGSIDRNDQSGFYLHGKTIRDAALLGDPTTPAGIFILAHEAGHHLDLQQQDRPEMMGWDSKYAEELFQERQAVAHALVKLRPFIKAGVFQGKDVRDYEIHHALASSAMEIKGKRVGDMKMAREMASDWDLDDYNDWEPVDSDW